MTKQTSKIENEKFKITTQEGLQAVRDRPGQFVGSTRSQNGQNPRALLQLMQELISNSIDEALAGYGKEISVTIHEDNSVTGIDYGRGIPMRDPNDPSDVYSSARRALTVLHSSGKFDSDIYAVSGGQNGVGLKALAGLSRYIEVDVNNTLRDKYHLKFELENLVEDHHEKSKKDEPTFTKITFLPDDAIFDTIVWDIEEVKRRLNNQAYLADGVKIILTDERIDTSASTEENPIINSWTYRYENGIQDLISHYAEGETLVAMKKPFRFKENVAVDTFVGDREIGVDVAFAYIESLSSQITSFANGIPTADGGPHVDALNSTMLKVFNDYVTDKKLAPKSKKLTLSDIQDGLLVAISMSIPGDLLQFESQTKEKLGTAEVIPAVKEIVTKHLTGWLYDNEKTAKSIIEKMLDAHSAREKAAQIRKDAQAARKAQKNGQGKLYVSGKYKPATSNDSKHKELFISEGQSASGNILQERYTKYQGVFPLRGKILNVFGMPLSKALENKEISTLVSILNAGVGKDFNPDESAYSRIIIASDSDVDGNHIGALLIVLFSTLFPGLIESGKLFVVDTPLYIGKKYIKGELITRLAYNDEDLKNMRKNGEIDSSYEITRLKGLGENSPEDTRTFIIEPETRHLRKITIGNVDEAKDALRILMGNDASLRAKWIEEEVDLDKY